MLACKQQVFLFSGGSNRATPTYMSKISCVAATKHEYRALLRICVGGSESLYQGNERKNKYADIR